jgi:hypothetical protein
VRVSIGPEVFLFSTLETAHGKLARDPCDFVGCSGGKPHAHACSVAANAQTTHTALVTLGLLSTSVAPVPCVCRCLRTAHPS